jgi:hypothetical protein
MAKTKDGVEFYLAEISPGSPDIDMSTPRKSVEAHCRSGDAVFVVGNNVYLAIVSDVPGAGTALRRLITLVRKEELSVKVRLLTEPFPQKVADAASQVIMGQVPVSQRHAKRETPGVDDVFEVEVRPDNK